MTDREIFINAPEGVTEEELQAYLEEACGGDADLRHRVDQLFAAERGMAGFLEEPADRRTSAIEATDSSHADGEGTVIGNYRLVRKIGEGGFGAVWMAEQRRPITRQVALKVVKAGMDTDEVLARFEAERQALARMEHANIAKVFDAGTTAGGRPFFAMELVADGIPITRFCDEQQHGVRRRLELFREVCSAVHHAHQKGVIHRDLKPSNILVTSDGGHPAIKVIDFGIAKAVEGRLTDRTLVTGAERFLGTPAYMSPEQAGPDALDVDTRTDIYSLGVLLYELLAGQPPFDPKTLASAGFEEMRRIIRDEDPPKPSTRATTARTATRTGAGTSKSLRGDLDWIVMKAIEKDRGRRYPSVNALSADIGRFLANEPVEAAAPSAAYRFRKFARRHRAGLGVAAALAAVLVAATALSVRMAAEANEARVEAETARGEAEVARGEAEAERREAEDVAGFLAQLLSSPDPARAGPDVRVIDLLDDAVAQLDSRFAGHPDRRAKMQATLASSYRALGRPDQAIELGEQAHAFFMAESGHDARQTLDVGHDLAIACFDAGRMDEAQALCEKVLEASERLLGPAAPETLATRILLANIWSETGRREEALATEREILALTREALGGEDPQTLNAMSNLANSLFSAGHYEEAMALRENVLDVRRRVLGEKHPDTVFTGMQNLADSYQAEGRMEEALELREKSLALGREVFGPDHSTTLRLMANLASTYHDVGRREEALALREKVLERRRRGLGSEHPDTLDAINDLAISCHDASRREEALVLREEVLQLCRKVHGPEHPRTLRAMNDVALSLHFAGRTEEAIGIMRELLAISTRASGPDHPETLWTVGNLSGLLDASGRRDEALELRERMVASGREVFGPANPVTLQAMGALASSLEAAGRADEALAMRRDAVAASREAHGAAHPSTVAALRGLAMLLHGTGPFEESIEVHRELLKLDREMLGPDHPETGRTAFNLAQACADGRRPDNAVEALEEAIRIGELQPSAEAPPWLEVARAQLEQAGAAVPPGGGPGAGAGSETAEGGD